MRKITVIIESSLRLMDIISEKLDEIVKDGSGVLEKNFTTGIITIIFTNKKMQNLDNARYIKIERIAELHEVSLEYRISRIETKTEKEEEPEFFGVFSPRTKYGLE